MAWKLEGTFFENCSCDAICPCTWSNLAHRATNDYCRAALAFRVERGDVDGVDVSGRIFVMVAETPALMSEGNWKVGVVVDDGASEEQLAKLGQVLSGQLGGPPAALGPLLGEFAGLQQAPIRIEVDGGTHRVVVGDSMDFTGVPQLTPDGDPVQLTNVVAHPAAPTLTVAPVERSTVSLFGISWTGEDLSGFTAPFSWAS